MRVFLVFLSAVMVVTPVFGLSASDEDKFAQNDLLFYDPEGSDTSCYGGGFANVCGETAAQKVYSGLVSVGFTPEQAVGVMGNMVHESMMNPAQWEQPYETSFDYYNDPGGVNGSGGGVGLIQWSGGRRVEFLTYMKSNAAHLMKYLEDWQTYSDGYRINGDKFIELAGEEDANAMLSVEIKYLYDEMMNNPHYKEVFEETTVENVTWKFLTNVEVPRGIRGSSSLAEAKSVKPERFEDAEKFWNELQNFTCESSTGGGVATDGSNVTIIGDSLTERSKTKLLELMPNADIDPDVGRSFATGIEIAKTKELRDIVVFALGTNSSGLTSADIDAAIAAIGSTRTIVFTTNYGTESSGLDFSGNNALFREAATANANVKIADWEGIAGEKPDEMMDVDGYHQSIPTGSDAFANMIYNVVSGMSGIGNGCGPGGTFAQLVVAYAWPEYHAAQFIERMPAYAEAVATSQSEGRYVGGSVKGVPGIDCGGFVTILMQNSGYETLYNTGPGGKGIAGNVTGQEPWVLNNGWTRLNPSGDVDTSLLQPGDVAFSGGSGPGNGTHTFVYVGEIAGFDSVIASASYSTSGTSGRAPMAGRESLTGGVRWYRKGAV